MSAEREIRAMAIGKWLLAMVVPASAMVIATLHTPTLIAMTLVAASSCALLWIHPPRRISRPSRWVLVALMILFGATLLQIIPLPASITGLLAPANADAWDRALTPFREAGPSWHPLTVAPPATHVEMLRGVLYGCVFVAALRVAFLDGGSRFLEAVVIASACLVALTTLAHTAVHADRVFGVYAPHDTQGYYAHRIGPLLNPNHVAAYCNVGALVATGVALGDRRLTPRALAGGAAVLLAGTSVWAGSRAGTGTLVLGLVFIGALTIYRRRRMHATVRVELLELLVVLTAVIAAGVLVALSASDIARSDLAALDMSKTEIARTALRLVPSSPFLGIGRGAFETMFPLVREGTTYFTFIRAEDLVAQWLVEWGVPFAVAALVVLVRALRPGVVLAADRPAVGAWAAITASVLHDLVDFHLEVPAVVVVVAVCVAVVVGRRSSGTERRTNAPSSRMPRAAAFALAIAAVLGTLLVVPDVGHTLAEDRDAIAKIAVDPSVPPHAFQRELRAAMLRYPAEPFFPLAGAIHAQAAHDGHVIPWIERALERYPTFGRAHLVLARSLVASRHRAQARLEYRLAYINDANVRAAVVREAPIVVEDLHSALELVPDGSTGIEMLESLASVLGDRLPATARALDDELLRREPAATGPLRRRALATMSDLANEHPWCVDRAACAADGVAIANALIARQPEKCEPHVLRARLEIAAGRTGAALDGLTSAINQTSERAECLRELVRLCLEAGEKRRADDALELAMRAGCGTREECIALYAWAASTEELRGNAVRAITFYKRVADLAPESGSNNLEHAAELAERAGLNGEALDAYQKLALRHPEDRRWRTRAEQLRAKASQDRLATPP